MGFLEQLGMDSEFSIVARARLGARVCIVVRVIGSINGVYVYNGKVDAEFSVVTRALNAERLRT